MSSRRSAGSICEQQKQQSTIHSFYTSSGPANGTSSTMTKSLKRKSPAAINEQFSVPEVVCPICSKRMRADVCMNNLHIDSCLEYTTRVPVSEISVYSLNGVEVVVIDDDDNAYEKKKLPVTTEVDVTMTGIGSEVATAPKSMVTAARPSLLVKTDVQTVPAVAAASFAGREFTYKYNDDWEPVPDVPGLYIMHDFITEEEELFLESHLENNDIHPWKPSSFNGHCLTKYWSSSRQKSSNNGSSSSSSSSKPSIRPRVVQKSMASSTVDTIMKEIDHMNEIPAYMQPIIDRFRGFLAGKASELPLELQRFNPNECNANLYSRAKGDYLRAHFDDRARSGPALVNISLCGDCKMTFKIPHNNPSTCTPSSIPRGGNSSNSPNTAGRISKRSSTSTWKGNGSRGTTCGDDPTITGAQQQEQQQQQQQQQPVSVLLPRRSLLFVSKKARYEYTHEIKAAHILNEKRISVTWRQSQVTWKQIAEERLQQQRKWNK